MTATQRATAQTAAVSTDSAEQPVSTLSDESSSTIADQMIKQADDCLQSLNLTQAYTYAKQALEAANSSADSICIARALCVLGDCELNYGRLEKAKPLFAKSAALAQSDGFVKAIATWRLGIINEFEGELVTARGNYDEAIKLFDKELKGRPKDVYTISEEASCYRSKGFLFFDSGDNPSANASFGKSIKFAEKAMLLDPDCLRAAETKYRAVSAQLSSLDKKHRKAISLPTYKKLNQFCIDKLARHPDNVRILLCKAQANIALANESTLVSNDHDFRAYLEQADELCERAIKLSPSHWRAQRVKGLIFQARLFHAYLVNDLSAAEKAYKELDQCFNKTLEKLPDNVELNTIWVGSKVLLVDYYSRHGRTTLAQTNNYEASVLNDKLLSRFPKNPDALRWKRQIDQKTEKLKLKVPTMD